MTEQEPKEVREQAYLHEIESVKNEYGPEGLRMFYQNMWLDFSGHRHESFLRKNSEKVTTPNPARSELRNSQSDADYHRVLDQTVTELGLEEELKTMVDNVYDVIKQEGALKAVDRTIDKLNELEQARKQALQKLYTGPFSRIYARLRTDGYNHYDITGITEDEFKEYVKTLK